MKNLIALFILMSGTQASATVQECLDRVVPGTENTRGLTAYCNAAEEERLAAEKKRRLENQAVVQVQLYLEDYGIDPTNDEQVNAIKAVLAKYMWGFKTIDSTQGGFYGSRLIFNASNGSFKRAIDSVELKNDLSKIAGRRIDSIDCSSHIIGLLPPNAY